MSRLTQALYFFMNEIAQMDEYSEDEESYIEDMKMISCNVINYDGDRTTCPYKKYSCEDNCPFRKEEKYFKYCDLEDVKITCLKYDEEVYDRFYEEIVMWNND